MTAAWVLRGQGPEAPALAFCPICGRYQPALVLGMAFSRTYREVDGALRAAGWMVPVVCKVCWQPWYLPYELGVEPEDAEPECEECGGLPVYCADCAWDLGRTSE